MRTKDPQEPSPASNSTPHPLSNLHTEDNAFLQSGWVTNLHAHIHFIPERQLHELRLTAGGMNLSVPLYPIADPIVNQRQSRRDG